MLSFTDAKIKDLKANPQKDLVIFDSNVNSPSGFGVKVAKSGNKTFIFQYSIAGKRRRMTLGSFPAFSTKAAREAAFKAKFAVETGVDPIRERNAQKLHVTLNDIIDRFLEFKVSGLSQEKAIARYLKTDLVGHLQVSDPKQITKKDLIDCIEAKAQMTPTAARQLLVYVKQLFQFMEDREYIDSNPAASIQSSRVYVKGRKHGLRINRKSRVLDDAELHAFWNTVENSGLRKLTAMALKFILVTGQRPNECAGLRFSEINGDVWTIPADRRGKTEDAHRVYLSDLAFQLIDQSTEERERLRKQGKQFDEDLCFFGSNGLQFEKSSLATAVARKRKFLNNKPELGFWTPHDLRRTMRTGLSALGLPQHLCERAIGHKASGIIETYDQYDYADELRMVFHEWSSELIRRVGR
jgi:integrase